MKCVKKSVGKVNHTLGVKLSHPYTYVCENNRLCVVWRFIKRSLGDTGTVSSVRGRGQFRWPAPELGCSPSDVC
jgi:hypothetical protein